MAYAPIRVTPMASDVSTGFERGGIFLVSDENALSKDIEHLHQPDACRTDIRPLLHLIEETILHMDASDVNLQDGAVREGIEECNAFPNTINRISKEMERQVLSGTSEHNVTLSVLGLLQHFSWDVKVVITLTAAIYTFATYWLRNFSKSLAYFLRMYEGQFEATKKLIKAILDTTKCVVEFEELSGMYFTDEHPELKAARSRIPIAVYMIIKSAVIAAAQITTMSSQKDG
ncbi:protein SIEVE ELEMENT OCCLUSION B-like [Chenopodium quinoa]|nr:protein SIEVE ELEMENT OCCLUSION B-like [Chenopodium quinoa]